MWPRSTPRIWELRLTCSNLLAELYASYDDVRSALFKPNDSIDVPSFVRTERHTRQSLPVAPPDLLLDILPVFYYLQCFGSTQLWRQH
jgi:hypothetical protein